MKFKLTSLIISLTICWSVFAQERPKLKTPDATAKAPTTSAHDKSDEEQELRGAIQSSGGDKLKMIDNLDAFLKKFPNSGSRAEIEGELFKFATELRDRNRQIAYAEKIVAANDREFEKLTVLVTALRERKAEGDLPKALIYADKLVKSVEDMFAARIKPAKISPGQWELQKNRAFASVHLLRGQVHNDLGNLDKADFDLTKSYKQSPLAVTVALLGNLAEKRKNTDQAIEFYLQAFVRSMEGAESSERDEIRHKLGQLYTAKNGSEKGLGDHLLKTYDTITKDDTERLAKVELPNPNENVSDPLLYKLTKLNGGDVRLADYKGKVIVANFWATWCGPCRIEMPELEKTMVKYKEDKDVIFLAINTDDDRNYVDPYVKGQKIKLPVVYANYLDGYFGINSIPTTMIFDRNGQVSFRQAGFNSNEDFVVMMSAKIEAAKKK